jgi:hypothetical protein
MLDTAAPICVFRDENVSVYFRRGSSPYTLATFAPIGFGSKITPFWGGTFCDKLDIECFGFVATRPNWFPARSMNAAIRAARPYSVKPVVNYGFSQGGYAAIKYSAALDAAGTVAGAPQFSIDPRVVPFDTRYSEHFRPALNEGMEICRQDQAGRVLLLLDPLQELDHENACRIIDQGHPDSITVPAFHMGHTVTDLLVDRQFILLLIAGCLGPPDMPAIMARLRQLKHRSLRYNIALARISVERRRPASAIAVLEAFSRNTPGPLNRKDRASYAMACMRAYGGAGLLAQALEQAKIVRHLRRRNATAQLKIGRLLLAIGAPAEAVAAFREASELEPDNAEFRTALDAALQEAGQA